MSDERDAVDAEGVADPELRDPGVLLARAGTARSDPVVELQPRRAMASTSVTSEKPSATCLAVSATLAGQQRRRRARRRAGSAPIVVSQGKLDITASPTRHRG